MSTVADVKKWTVLKLAQASRFEVSFTDIVGEPCKDLADRVVRVEEGNSSLTMSIAMLEGETTSDLFQKLSIVYSVEIAHMTPVDTISYSTEYIIDRKKPVSDWSLVSDTNSSSALTLTFTWDYKSSNEVE